MRSGSIKYFSLNNKIWQRLPKIFYKVSLCTAAVLNVQTLLSVEFANFCRIIAKDSLRINFKPNVSQQSVISLMASETVCKLLASYIFYWYIFLISCEKTYLKYGFKYCCHLKCLPELTKRFLMAFISGLDTKWCSGMCYMQQVMNKSRFIYL